MAVKYATQNTFPSSVIQKWKEKIQEILANSDKVDEKTRFLLEYGLRFCQLRLALIRSEDTKPFRFEVDSMEDKGYSLGFGQDDFGGINRVFLAQSEGELERNLRMFQTKYSKLR